jgi:hypothetical protein
MNLKALALLLLTLSACLLPYTLVTAQPIAALSPAADRDDYSLTYST